MRTATVLEMFFDSNVLLFAFLDNDQSGEDANELLRKVRDGHIKATISPLVLDEVMWGLKNAIGRELTDRVIDSFMAMPFVWLDISFGCIRHARARFRDGLDPRDAFHAAVMDHYGLAEIVSEDTHFTKVKGIHRQSIKETISIASPTNGGPR